MEDISTASRVRQGIATALAMAGGIYAALYGALNWELVAVILGGLWAYTSKSVLQQAVAALQAFFASRAPR